MSISTDAYIEVNELTFQVHIESFEDTRKFARLLLGSLLDERDRWHAAAAAHDYQAMDESAAEQRDIVALLGVLIDAIRAVERWSCSRDCIVTSES
jgi:hypothetical protein